MLKLFKVSYRVKHSDSPIKVKFIKSYTRLDAIAVGIPTHANGIELSIDSIEIDCLCEVDEILNCTPAGKEE